MLTLIIFLPLVGAAICALLPKDRLKWPRWVAAFISAVDLGLVAFLVVAPVAWWVLGRTPLGLSIRAVGENPEAADAAGITLSGYAYGQAGWHGVAALGLIMLTVPLVTGLREMRQPALPEKSQEKLSPGA